MRGDIDATGYFKEPGIKWNGQLQPSTIKRTIDGNRGRPQKKSSNTDLNAVMHKSESRIAEHDEAMTDF